MDCTYWLDGVDLHSPTDGRYVMLGTELPSFGAPRTRSTTVPGRRGVLAQRSLSSSELDATVSMMIVGDDYAELESRMAVFLAALPMERFATLTKVMGDVRREAACTVKSVSDPEFKPGDCCFEFTVVFTIPGGAWLDETAVVSSAGNPMTSLAGGNTGYEVQSIAVKPSAGRVEITDVASGDVLVWEGTVVSNYSLMVYPADFTACWVIDSDTVDVSNEISLPVHGWTLTPDASGNVGVELVGALPANVTFTARKAYR